MAHDFGFTFLPPFPPSFSSKKLLTANYSSCTICTMNFISNAREHLQINKYLSLSKLNRLPDFIDARNFRQFSLARNGRATESEKRHSSTISSRITCDQFRFRTLHSYTPNHASHTNVLKVCHTCKLGCFANPSNAQCHWQRVRLLTN